MRREVTIPFPRDPSEFSNHPIQFPNGPHQFARDGICTIFGVLVTFHSDHPLWYFSNQSLTFTLEDDCEDTPLNFYKPISHDLAYNSL